MTVCIAAITRERYIVTASDLMVSSALSSSDASAVKLEEFHKDWIAMMSADDLTQCLPVIERAERNFQGRANTLRVARACFKRAYQGHLAELAGDRVLGRFGLDMEAFRKSGRRRFTEQIFNTLSNEIRDVKVEAQFLACGFDGRAMPHLFTVTEPGTDSVYDKPGFCAIGSGMYAAEGMLHYLGQTVDSTVHQTIFNVYAAKFMAERIPGVGEKTFLFVKKQGCDAFSMETWVEPTIRDRWNTEGKPRIPDGLISQLETVHLDFFPSRR